MPTEPAPITLFEIAKRAVEISDPTGADDRLSGLLEQFESTTVFWEQFLVAKKIVALHDTSVLPHLEPWLRCEDMRRRGNAAFIFARLGDGRGFHIIKAILEDRSTICAVFEIDSTGRPSLGRQIREDRYYAAHLLGDSH